MRKGKKELVVVGDRVLIRLEEGEERSKVGLYLPATAVENQAVQGGTIVATGPGQPLPEVSDHLDEIDRTIAAHSEGWTVDRMASVDRTVLRVAAYELAFGREVPVGVAIDEAVRAAKDLSTEDSGRFVNGVLGKIARELDPDQA